MAAKSAKPHPVKVVFTLPAEVEANHVALCGEFNNWSADDIELSRDDDGTWRTTVSLEPGRAYRYRYLLDGQRWENAWEADSYLPNPYGEDDSVVVVAV
jgi:1,4-alpha-glucan branching enzyme